MIFWWPTFKIKNQVSDYRLLEASSFSGYLEGLYNFYFSSNFDAVFFFELILLRASGRLIE
jgi:hypothetical protein